MLFLLETRLFSLTKKIDGFICAFSTSFVLNREPASFSSTNAQGMSHGGTQRSIFQLHFIVCLPEYKYLPEIFDPRRISSTLLNKKHHKTHYKWRSPFFLCKFTITFILYEKLFHDCCLTNLSLFINSTAFEQWHGDMGVCDKEFVSVITDETTRISSQEDFLLLRLFLLLLLLLLLHQWRESLHRSLASSAVRLQTLL